MAGSVNKVILVGNLGKDPEVRYLESGVAVANFSLATSESYNDRNTGQRVTNTEWHNIVLWRGLAEVAEKYLKKGNAVYIEGKLRNRNYQDREGNTRYITEVVADNMVMLGRQSDSGGGQQGGTPAQPAQPANPQSQPSSSETPKSPTDDTFTTDETDDLPF